LESFFNIQYAKIHQPFFNGTSSGWYEAPIKKGLMDIGILNEWLAMVFVSED
jgi:hypothetical protein